MSNVNRTKDLLRDITGAYQTSQGAMTFLLTYYVDYCHSFPGSSSIDYEGLQDQFFHAFEQHNVDGKKLGIWMKNYLNKEDAK